MWLYVVIQAGALGSRVLPLTLRYRIATVIADLLWLVWASKRRACIDNMAVVISGSPTDREVRQLARRSFHQFGKAIVDFLGFTNIDPEDPRLTDMPVEGWNHVEAGLARGKGVILASGHFGSTDMGGIALAHRVNHFCAVADRFEPPYVDRLIRKTREARGYELIPAASVRQIIRALHNNSVVVMLFDRPLPVDQGVAVSFFGLETAFPAGPAMMAHHTGATVVPAYIIRNDNNSFRGKLCPSVTENLPEEKDRAIRVVMQRLTSSLEQAIRETPEQWYMFRPMWPQAIEREATASHSLAVGS